MESLVEPIRYTTSLFALATAIAIGNSLKSVPRLVLAWLALAAAAGWFFTHVTRSLPSAAMIPAIGLPALVLGVAFLFSPRGSALFAALDDRQWRMLMLTRAVFGPLLLASGAVGILPLTFAVPAGLGDLLVGALAIIVPGSLAAGGHRGARLLVFGVGLIDFLNVIRLQVLVVVPWFAETHGVGISLLLPWVVVPMLATLNVAGLKLVLTELLKAPVPTA